MITRTQEESLYRKNHRQSVLVLSLLLFSIGFSSCNFWACTESEGPVGERELEINSASELEISIPAEVSYWLDENRTSSLVVLRAEENLLDLILVESKDGELSIQSEKCLNSQEGIRIEIITPSIEEVTLNRLVNFAGKNEVQTKDLNLSINGAGRIEMNLKASDVDCEISGSGDLNLSGTSDELEIKINGAGNVEAVKLASKSVSVKINGAGDIRVFAQEKLDVKINGAGKLQYKGKPSDIHQKINGAGDVSEIQEETGSPI